MLWHKLFEDLQDYLDLDEETLREKLNYSHQAVVDHWKEWDPGNKQEREQFYVDTDTYLLELAAWILDFPGRQSFHTAVTTFVESLKLETALDFGCGIANEGLELAVGGLQVSLCDVSPISLDFAMWRAKKHGLNVKAVESEALESYDLCVLIDVIGHVEDPEELIIMLARHSRYLFYTQDFQLPPPHDYWPMHLYKPANFDRVMQGVWKKLHGGFYESLIFRPSFVLDPSLKNFGGGEGGVKRQVEALTALLPQYGIDISEEATFAHNHATGKDPRNLVYTSHGYYPWGTTVPGEKAINEILKQSIATAKRVIAVSDEAASLIETHLKTPVTVIRNGVSLGLLDRVEENHFERMRGLKQPFFLWAKNSVEGVCDPTSALELARLLPQHHFVFTKVIGRDIPKNVTVVGTLSHPLMLELIRDCAVFLGTTKEQFSVQTLEAMGLSKPVLCLPEGGNAKVISHKIDGYIAQSWQELPEGALYCLEYREELGNNARAKIAEMYEWNLIVPQVVEVYKDAIEDYIADLKRPLVSVIIPHYNLTEFLPQTLDSVLAQTLTNVEIIVIDDGSTQSLRSIVEKYKDQPIRFIKQKNQGVSAARNNAIRASSGRYICCLDADDQIKPDFLSKLVSVLESDSRIGLAYCDFELFDNARGVIKTAEYKFETLMKSNFIPCCNVFRREAWERAGGYKNINPSWEDYELWLNMGKLGFYGTRVPETLFLYRKRKNAGRDFQSHGHEARLRATVNSYHPDLYTPAVSIVIPTYQHTHYLPEVFKSLKEQTFHDFEVIVVDDGNEDAKKIREVCDEFREDLPIRILRHDTNLGLASARNTGVSDARGKYVLTLDADDMIKPTFLDKTVEVLEQRPDIAIVYTDIETFGSFTKIWEMPDYDFNLLLQKNLMACASLYRREVFTKLGGYKTDMPWGWEDYDFWIRAGRIGYCGLRLAEPLFMYRRFGETMILRAQKHVPEMRDKLKEHSPDVFRGERPMGCCGKTRITNRSNVMRQGFVGVGPGPQTGEYPLVKMEYKLKRPLLVKGSVTGTFYNVTGGQQIWIDPRDAPQLLSRGDFQYAEEREAAVT